MFKQPSHVQPRLFIAAYFSMKSGAADGDATVPQPQCHPGEHESPVVPVRFFLESYLQSHTPMSTTGKTKTQRGNNKLTLI